MSARSKKRRRDQRAATPGHNDRATESSLRPKSPEHPASARNDLGDAERVVGAVLQAIVEPLGIPGEHRDHPRVALHVEIDVHSESHFFSGLSGDVSEGGLFVQTYRPLQMNQEIDVSFQLGERLVQARARVRWRREKTAESEPGFGLEFDALGEEDRAAVKAFCEQRAPLYYDVR